MRCATERSLACVLLVYATRGQLAEHPRILHATPCERTVLAARRSAAAIPFNESELAVLEATAVRSAARYEGDSLEVFAHLPHSGGTAWSWRLAATFPVTEIAPGSGFSRGYERNHTPPDDCFSEVAGVFDLRRKTLTVWKRNPKAHEPDAVFSLW